MDIRGCKLSRDSALFAFLQQVEFDRLTGKPEVKDLRNTHHFQFPLTELREVKIHSLPDELNGHSGWYSSRRGEPLFRCDECCLYRKDELQLQLLPWYDQYIFYMYIVFMPLVMKWFTVIIIWLYLGADVVLIWSGNLLLQQTNGNWMSEIWVVYTQASFQKMRSTLYPVT